MNEKTQKNIKATQAVKPAKATQADKVKKAYDKALASRTNPLDGRECEIIERYYAFNGFNRHTLKEISEHFNVTRERIRQIKHHALNKII